MLWSNTERLGFIRKLHDLIRNNTCQGVCTADEQRFATTQVRVSTNKNGLKRVSTNRHGAKWTCHDNQSVHTKVPPRLRIQVSYLGYRSPLVLEFLPNIKCLSTWFLPTEKYSSAQNSLEILGNPGQIVLRYVYDNKQSV